MGTIAVIACCDTKYHEISYAKDVIKKCGHTPLVLDISTGKNVILQGDMKREEVLLEGGYEWSKVSTFEKSKAISAMSESITKVLSRLYSEGKIQGVFGMGGLQNTVVCSVAFRQLPLGFPKVIASTIASGYRYFDTVVGESDIMVLPSIVDFTGINIVSEVILQNSISALVGMVQYGKSKLDTSGRYTIGTTLMGITNDTVMEAVNQLSDKGIEVLSFHSTGIGGKTMEQMIDQGYIQAVMDVTLHEMTAEYFGNYGYSKGSEHRLEAGAKSGIPMLVCPGGIDFICLRKEELFPDQEQRGYVWHNDELTHTKLYEHEILDITHTIVNRLNEAKGDVMVILPMGGLRTFSKEGEEFYKPETILKMKKIFEEELVPSIELKCVDYNYMDIEFADVLASNMQILIERNRKN